MNLHSAQCEIKHKPPRTSFSWIVAELALVVAVAGVLVQIS